jgi:hypothetical protein
MTIENKIFAISNCKIENSNGDIYLTGYANTKGIADRYGDVPTIYKEKRDFVYELTEFKKNPVMLIDHKNSVENIAGSFEDIFEDDNGLFFKAKFSKSDYPLIKHTRQVYLEGHAKALSIGGQWFFEDEKNPHNLTLAKIFEISLVAVPADPNALATALQKALKMINIEIKNSVPFQNLPLADRDRAWDSGQAIARVRAFTGSEEEPTNVYKKAFLWWDLKNENNFYAYKLPIADVIDGQMYVIPRAIFAATAALRGARGGVEIPEADKQSIISNIERYYEKMELESPFKKTIENEIEELITLKELSNYSFSIKTFSKFYIF